MEVLEQKNARAVITATWDDAPHLDKGMRDELAKTIPEYQRDARMRGIPNLGSGLIYQCASLEDILIADFEIPAHWMRGYGFDVGWNRTAAAFMAWDIQTDTVYLWSEHYMGGVSPYEHAGAIKARGEWMLGHIDPSANGERKAEDGEQLTNTYRKLGLNLELADNSVEAGIYEAWLRLSSGRFKVFKTCKYFQEEYRMYRRDLKGKPVKRNDHLMDAFRYGLMAISKWTPKPAELLVVPGSGEWVIGGNAQGWMSN